MPQEFFIGRDCALSIAGVTHNFSSVRVALSTEATEFNPLDSGRKMRKVASVDASITLEGYQSTATGGGNFALLGQALLNQTTISAITWTDTAGTPVTQLPADFFDTVKGFPVSTWRVTGAEGGPSGQTSATMWSATLTPSHV